MLGSPFGQGGSPLHALQVAQALHLVFTVQHLEEVTLMGTTVGYGYHLWGKGKTILLHLAGEIKWSVKVPVEQYGACSSCCFTVIHRGFCWMGTVGFEGFVLFGSCLCA